MKAHARSRVPKTSDAAPLGFQGINGCRGGSCLAIWVGMVVGWYGERWEGGELRMGWDGGFGCGGDGVQV